MLLEIGRDVISINKYPDNIYPVAMATALYDFSY